MIFFLGFLELILMELNYIFATFLSFSFPYIFLVIEIFVGLNPLYLHKKHRRWTNSFWIKHFEMFPDIFSQILLIIWQKKTFTLNSFLAMKLSHRRCFVKKGVLKNFAKLTGKHLCQSLFLNKVAGRACNFIKKESLAQVFSCEFCEFFKNTFFTEHLRVTASETELLSELSFSWNFLCSHKTLPTIWSSWGKNISRKFS